MNNQWLNRCKFWEHWISIATVAAAKSLQSCPTLCDPIDGSPPGSPIPGILQARTLEWVAVSFSNPWKWKVKVKSLSRVWLFMTLWTAAYQAPLSMGFSRQEYWSGVPLPSPDLLLSNRFKKKTPSLTWGLGYENKQMPIMMLELSLQVLFGPGSQKNQKRPPKKQKSRPFIWNLRKLEKLRM